MTIIGLGLSTAIFVACCFIMLFASARASLSAPFAFYTHLTVWGASAIAAPFFAVRAMALGFRSAARWRKSR